MNVHIPHARNSDPETSHEAAASIAPTKIRASQLAILVILTRYPKGLCDQHLGEHYQRAMLANPGLFPMQSSSGLRTRRKELVERGSIRDTGETVVLKSGRRSIVWAAA